MPELPEVETLRRDLSATVVGRTIQRAQIAKPKLFQPAAGLDASTLQGRRVEELRRRGKLLIWQLSDGLTLVMHLKMTGQLVHHSSDGTERAHGGHPVPTWGAPLPHKSTHVTFHFDDESVLYLTDIRQFARVWLLDDAGADQFVAAQKLGPEPLTEQFGLGEWRARLQRRSIPIKSALLLQNLIGGIGNIYADEALWDARIHPSRPANSLTTTEIKRLHGSIKQVLEYAVREGVAFVPRGRVISERAFPYCHGREGSPCPRCAKPILKDWVGGRGTYWCPRCQKLSRRARAA